MSWAYDTPHPNPVVTGTLADLELQRGNYGKVMMLAEELASERGQTFREENLKANFLKSQYLKGVSLHKMNHNKEALQYFETMVRSGNG